MGNQDNRPVAYTYANVPPMVSRSSMSLASVSNNNPYEVNIKIMIAAIVVLFSVILFILALHLYAKWFWKNHQFGSRRRRQQQIQQHFDDDPLLNNPAFGLDKALLEALPTFVFKQGEPASIPTNGADCCAVCLCEFQEGDAGRVLPKCAHAFHTECINMWLYCHTTCPLCRAGIVSAPWEAPAKTDLAAVDLRVLDSVASPAIVLSLEGLLMNSEPGVVQTSGSLRHLLEANEAGVAGGLDADEQQQQPFTTGSSKSAQECGSVCGDQRGSHRLLVIEPVLPQATATTGSTSAGGCSQAAAAAAPKSPKSRWRNLRRMLSRDRRIAPASSSSSSASWAAAAAGVECDQAEGRVVVLLVE